MALPFITLVNTHWENVVGIFAVQLLVGVRCSASIGQSTCKVTAAEATNNVLLSLVYSQRFTAAVPPNKHPQSTVLTERRGRGRALEQVRARTRVLQQLPRFVHLARETARLPLK